MQNRPLYPIGIVAEILNVHPETIRIWERHGLVRPQRRQGKRYYSENDLKRLQFIQKLTEKGLNIPAISHYLLLYPCWHREGCPVCMHRVSQARCCKLCWKEENTFCQVSVTEDLCSKCEYSEKESTELTPASS